MSWHPPRGGARSKTDGIWRRSTASGWVRSGRDRFHGEGDTAIGEAGRYEGVLVTVEGMPAYTEEALISRASHSLRKATAKELATVA